MSEEQLQSLFTVMFDIAHPIGSYYITEKEDSSDNLIVGGGGTSWTKVENKFLFGSGSKNVGVTGGEETVILTFNQIPSHTHNASTNTTGRHNHSYHTAPHSFAEQDQSQEAIISPSYGSSNAVTKETYYNGDHSHTVTVNATGGSQSHNNMPPYLVVNIWKRVG